MYCLSTIFMRLFLPDHCALIDGIITVQSLMADDCVMAQCQLGQWWIHHFWSYYSSLFGLLYAVSSLPLVKSHWSRKVKTCQIWLPYGSMAGIGSNYIKWKEKYCFSSLCGTFSSGHGSYLQFLSNNIKLQFIFWQGSMLTTTHHLWFMTARQVDAENYQRNESLLCFCLVFLLVSFQKSFCHS